MENATKVANCVDNALVMHSRITNELVSIASHLYEIALIQEDLGSLLEELQSFRAVSSSPDVPNDGASS
jgi:hypothetical protein